MNITDEEKLKIIADTTASVAKAQGKVGLNPTQMRQFQIMLSDAMSELVENRKNPHPDWDEQAFWEKIKRLEQMKSGAIPFDPLGEIIVIELPKESAGTPTFKTFWYGKRQHMREMKELLQQNLGLKHYPHAMAIGVDDMPSAEIVRFSVDNVTREETVRIRNANEKYILDVKIVDEEKKTSTRVGRSKREKGGRLPMPTVVEKIVEQIVEEPKEEIPEVQAEKHELETVKVENPEDIEIIAIEEDDPVIEDEVEEIDTEMFDEENVDIEDEVEAL